jgi:hypothetical protein
LFAGVTNATGTIAGTGGIKKLGGWLALPELGDENSIALNVDQCDTMIIAIRKMPTHIIPRAVLFISRLSVVVG